MNRSPVMIVIKWSRLPWQLLFYAGFALAIGHFSLSPAYRYASAEMATVKISLSHAADRVKPCIRLTPQQIAELPPNMRRTEKCERERLPLTLQFEVDGELLIDFEALPSGLWKDGTASVYQRLDLQPGAHRLTVRLRDSARGEGWDYTRTETLVLDAGRYLTVTFKEERGGFSFQ